MTFIKKLYANAYYFWFISRIVFIILMFISVTGIISEGGLRPHELLINVIGIALTIFLLIVTIQEISKSNVSKILRMLGGLCPIAISITLLVILNSDSGSIKLEGLAYFVSILLLLLGIYDVLNVQRLPPERKYTRS